jgi:glycerol-3-phosphate acyltransferase PlsY
MDTKLILEIGLLILVYLFGSIPFSVILGKKYKGVDVREHGSGNTGGTNSIRWLGKGLGFTVAILDGLKGGLVILLVSLNVFQLDYIPVLLYGIVGAAGQVFPIYLKFRGGKGVAAFAGILIGYNPIWALIGVSVFFLVIKLSKYVSIGSTSIPITIVILSLIWHFTGLHFPLYTIDPNAYFLDELLYILFMLGLIVFRHQSNYRNIKNGVEPKVLWAMGKGNQE